MTEPLETQPLDTPPLDDSVLSQANEADAQEQALAATEGDGTTMGMPRSTSNAKSISGKTGRSIWWKQD